MEQFNNVNFFEMLVNNSLLALWKRGAEFFVKVPETYGICVDITVVAFCLVQKVLSVLLVFEGVIVEGTESVVAIFVVSLALVVNIVATPSVSLLIILV